VVGGTGTILTSPDGITWTARTSGTTDHLNGVAWSSIVLLFVAVGANGTIRTSPNGTTWTTRFGSVSSVLNDVVWSDALSRFVIAALDTTLNVLTSPDGVTWTARATPKAVFFAVAVATANYALVAGTGWILVSTDGVNWQVADASVNLRGGVWTGQGAVLVGETGAILRSHRILT
jgi:hypothetical protein